MTDCNTPAFAEWQIDDDGTIRMMIDGARTRFETTEDADQYCTALNRRFEVMTKVMRENHENMAKLQNEELKIRTAMLRGEEKKYHALDAAVCDAACGYLVKGHDAVAVELYGIVNDVRGNTTAVPKPTKERFA